jgi:hypothetical protein
MQLKPVIATELKRGRLPAHGFVVALLAATAVLGAVSVLPASAGATPPFHCVGSPSGQDCTNGSDPGGGPWAPPDHYDFGGMLRPGSWDIYVRSDGLDVISMDLYSVQAATGAPECKLGTSSTYPSQHPWVLCRH